MNPDFKRWGSTFHGHDRNDWSRCVTSDCTVLTDIYIYIYVILIPQARVLCLIYTHKPEGRRPEGACVYIRQSTLCTTLPMQADSPPIRGGNQDLLYRLLVKNRLWACTCKQEPPLYLRLSTKTGESYGKRVKFL